MQKSKENLFLEKFSLLNSQEHNADIKWSSSSSSDYENTSCNDKVTSKPRNRKRKRKKKVPKNISNLDITIVDASKDHKSNNYREKSPILMMKSVEPTSPILTSRFPPNKHPSPILSMKNLQQKSPILISKAISPNPSKKIRKTLSYNEINTLKEDNNDKKEEKTLGFNFKTPDRGIDYSITSKKTTFSKVLSFDSNDSTLENDTTDGKSSFNLLKSSDDSESSLKAKLKLIKNVKNYFDSHFSSENTLQNISDTPTPEDSLKNETVDILSCRTQTGSNLQPFRQDSTLTSNSDTSTYFEKNKKIKYKKGGLAYRLNMLLKKQNAHISLWQHERFLAGTSNFVIPKGEHAVFCIQKIDFKYGCYLLDAIDVKNDKYVIFINSLYVNSNIVAESVLKLYEPYKILESDNKNYKIVINVCKFECYDLKNR